MRIPQHLDKPEQLTTYLKEDSLFQSSLVEAVDPENKIRVLQRKLWVASMISTVVLLLLGITRVYLAFRGPLMILLLFMFMAALAPLMLKLWWNLRLNEENIERTRGLFEALKHGWFTAQAIPGGAHILEMRGGTTERSLAMITQSTMNKLEEDRVFTADILSSVGEANLFTQPLIPQNAQEGAHPHLASAPHPAQSPEAPAAGPAQPQKKTRQRH